MSTTTTRTTGAAGTRRGADSSTWRTGGGDSGAQGNTRNRGRGGGRHRVRQRGPSTSAKALECSASLENAITGGIAEPPPVRTPAVPSNSTADNTTIIEKTPTIPVRPSLTLRVLPNGPALDPTSPSSPSKPNARRRRNHKRNNSSTQVPQEKSLAPHNANGHSASPLASSDTRAELPEKDPKDLPSHLLNTAAAPATLSDSRNDNPIDTLVEHVRNMAMEKHRPDSPSGHIDWAGADDDDSLPDLEDWGVSSKLTSEANTSGKMAEPTLSATSGDGATSAPAPPQEARVAGNGPAPKMDVSPSESTYSRAASPVAKRERKRERGSRKGEKRGRNGQPTNESTVSPLPAVNTNKKSLAERLSSPVRRDVVRTSLSRADLKQTTLPARPLLPPKSANGLMSSQPPSNTSNKNTTRITVTETSPSRNRPPSPQSSDTAVASSSPERKGMVLEKLPMDSGTDVIKPFEKTTTPAFDWSEEPIDIVLSQTKTGGGPDVEVQPPTPLEASDGARSTVFNRPLRHQRPLSSDTTSRNRRERSPHKVHNPRNHSTPNAMPLIDASRAGAPRSTRPVIRSDVFAMLSRSLRDSPPPRRDSPNPPASS